MSRTPEIRWPVLAFEGQYPHEDPWIVEGTTRRSIRMNQHHACSAGQPAQSSQPVAQEHGRTSNLAGVRGALITGFVLAVALAVSVNVGAARAGDWTYLACKQPGGQPAAVEGWATGAIGSVGAYSGDDDACAQGGALEALVSGQVEHPAYNGPEWVFTTPPGEEIAGGDLTASLSSPVGQAWIATPESSYEAADVLINCQYNLECGPSGTLTGTVAITHLGGEHLYSVAVCVPPVEGATTCSAGGGTDASVSIGAAEIKLSNHATPAGSGFTGTLLQPNARGSAGLLFAATDTEGPGVYKVIAEVDGKALYDAIPDGNDGECEALGEREGTLEFDHLHPCPDTEDVELPINTAVLADGQHTLKVVVSDASKNTSTVYDATITTNNAPADTSGPSIVATSQPTVGSALSVKPGEWSAPAGAGSISYGYQWEACNAEGGECQPIATARSSEYAPAPSDVGHTLRAVVTAADNDGQTTATTTPTTTVAAAQSSLGAEPGPGGSLNPGGTSNTTNTTTTNNDNTSNSITNLLTNGIGASSKAVIRLGVNRRITRSYAQRAFVLNGRLLSSQGTPIGEATVQILEQSAGALRLIGQAATGATGAFSAQVPAGASRLIEVAYRAGTTETGYAAMAEVEESVAAGVRLHITPTKTGATGTIHLSGQVLGEIPRRGVIVDLLVHYRGRWVPFRTPRTGAKGHFTVPYQFEGSVGRFPFFARVPAGQAGFDYTVGQSHTINVNTR